MSILYVQRRPRRSGAQTCLARLVGHPAIKALNPVVLASADGWLTDECERLGVRAIIEPFPSSRSLGGRLWGNREFARRVSVTLRKAGVTPLLVHANDHGEGLIGEALKRHLAVPGIMTLRSPGMSRRDLIKYRCGHYEILSAVGPRIRDKSNAWLETERTRLIHDGLAAEDFAELKDIPDHPPDRILAVGSAVAWKGWSDLTTALAIAYERGSAAPSGVDFTGLLPDPGLNDLGLARFGAKRLRFLGHRLDFKDLVRRYDLVINPSRMEGFGMAAVETIAAGVPLLSTRVGVLEDVLPIDAMLCDPGDPESMCRAIENIYRSWQTLKQREFGLRDARSTLRREYSMDQTVSGYLNAYDALLGKP